MQGTRDLTIAMNLLGPILEQPDAAHAPLHLKKRIS
jgi:hypothetical protein